MNGPVGGGFDRAFVCSFDPSYCGGAGVSIGGPIAQFFKRHWQECATGAAFGVAEGPEAALVGCGSGLLIAYLESSSNKPIHDVGVALAVASAVNDLNKLRLLSQETAAALRAAKLLTSASSRTYFSMAVIVRNGSAIPR